MDLRKSGDDFVADRERLLTLVVKGLVAAHSLLVPGLANYRLDFIVHHDGGRSTKSIQYENALCWNDGNLWNAKRFHRINVKLK